MIGMSMKQESTTPEDLVEGDMWQEDKVTEMIARMLT